MANSPNPDMDDDFSELYKEYTGPPGSNATNVQDKEKTNKRPQAGSDGEEEPHDPNAVPTDFTSREAKVWEAKSKATERNWKKRKEEEMICKICGESGHFTQGCPSTLGANRKFEKDIGCKIKVEDKFIIVSGKDRLILSKGVDAVHKVKAEGEKKGSSSHTSRSRSPERRSPVSSRFGRSDSQRSLPSPRNPSQFQPRFGRQDKVVEDRVHEDLQKLARGSPQARGKFLCSSILCSVLKLLSWVAYGNNRARGRLSNSKSPKRIPYTGNSYDSHDGHSKSFGVYRTGGWGTERQGPDVQSGHNLEHLAFPQTLEELELEYKREAMELGRIRDEEEDEENYKHREAVRDMKESYMKKLAILRGTHAKQWEQFLQLDAQRRLQRARQQISTSEFGGYKQPNYPEYDNPSGNAHYAGGSIPMDSRGRYPNPIDNYASARPQDTYGDFQRQRRDDYGKAYNRY
ncbi:zinc knuckle (CCHC-type) family protein [Actinidia rufa]|uniref:Zinc knuckle (CCHC-type) family protein n=1 Tax=Actinidia rufa TaxID=165716 RepID=A0A7J0H8G4_9ERIC|nr:zinc knuckle (CCHC-type) family protein [Actinidia rufa]